MFNTRDNRNKRRLRALYNVIKTFFGDGDSRVDKKSTENKNIDFEKIYTSIENTNNELIRRRKRGAHAQVMYKFEMNLARNIIGSGSQFQRFLQILDVTGNKTEPEILTAFNDVLRREKKTRSVTAPLDITPFRSLETRRCLSLKQAEEEGKLAEINWYADAETITPSQCLGWGPLPKLTHGAGKSFPIGKAVIENATVFGKCDAVFLSCGAFLHEHLSHSEGRNVNVIERWCIESDAYSAVTAPVLLKSNLEFDEAITMVGKSTDGFGHWHYDYLPRWAALEWSNVGPGIPILVDSGMPETHYESLRLIAPSNPFISISEDSAVSVGRLHYANRHAWMPTILKKDAVVDPANVVMARSTIRYLRDTLRAKVDGATDGDLRLYVRRDNLRRRSIDNIDEITDAVRSADFFETNMAEFCFKKQVELVSRTKSFIAPLGSAADHLIYLPENSRCLILTSENFGSYANAITVFSEIGLNVRFVAGQYTKKNEAKPKQSSFEIDCDDFRQGLSWVLFED